MIYIGSDHGGFELKTVLAGWLKTWGVAYQDVGADSLDTTDDYPLYAQKVAEKVSTDATSQGILLCRSGQGVAIVANKYPSVRAAVCWNALVAAASRTDDDVNILCIPCDYVTEEEAQAIVQTWLGTDFIPDTRFTRRLQEITAIEQMVRR